MTSIVDLCSEFSPTYLKPARGIFTPTAAYFEDLDPNMHSISALAAVGSASIGYKADR